MEIISVKEGNKFKFFKKFKIFFKEFEVQMKEKEIYDYKFSKELIPNIKGIGIIRYLLNKSTYHSLNKSSDFGNKVFVKLSDFNYKGHKEYSNSLKKEIFTGIVIFKGNFLDSNNRMILSMETSFNVTCLKEPNKEFFEKLLSLSFSGIYGSPRDEEYILDFIFEEKNKYGCSDCSEKFSNLNELYNHIIEENHYDSILDYFPFDAEIIRIKKIFQERNK